MIFLTSAVVLGITATFCLWIEMRKWYLNRTKLRAFSKLKEYPILGIGGRFLGLDNEASMAAINQLFYEKDDRPFASWLGPTIAIGIDDPEDMYIVLNADQFLDKPYLYSHLRNATGLFSSEKELWKLHRRILNPTFNKKIMNNFLPTINRKTQVLVHQLERHVGTSFDIYRAVFKALVDVIMNTGLGMKWELQTKRGDDIHDIFIEVMNSFQSRVVRFWYKWDFVYSFTKACDRELILLEKGYRVLRSVREVKEIELLDKLENGVDELGKAKEENTLTWIQKCFLMYREGLFTEQNLIEEIDTIFVGGTDTTSVTISSTLIMLAIYPEIQDKVVTELHELFGNVDGDVTADDISKLTYLEMVIKESVIMIE